ncbi:protein Wnt-4 [Exaiptasia diaphana]|uniref:Protein Wnt n=1 Tax=Exaiptasia diaphana TaxID=2652724 RepID=A0A913XI17_EXADI|nr:protein Wnt-4 [Exaiptasia diaphana]XP_020902345.1 protein Wnt-4 [Exaiptasia diaphana]XP_020902346.1 protein Wnt-4 [Exaiptasia diaphana]XP_020902347.1 protein Wnt-4 [Exaiptasia diaphana]XP_020904744.1 protein Wnt-4 [Exaiptasia diaphana]XP_020904751.1 protein Wnt-4 [Exaiptasia diaphana]XP_020904759.1 protein Wnt-4 [Exaiptasia diaphana]XP_020904766.1 protein Wnt-4 [Exaiptasia diaphana]KXJ06150.1 Protein Wnt-4 [Exaiptasia diaphana]KXJ13062.1 Protein Wnt-4 [Exaiptasia diaphana]
MNLGRAGELLLWLILLVPSSLAIRWLGIQHGLDHNWRKKDCNKRQGFTGKQYSMCRRNLPIMKYVREAVEMTREECVYQMQQRRWNCSSIHKAPRYMNDLKRGTKEAAYVYSLSAAAVSYSVTQACSTRQLGSICSCGRNPRIRLKRKDQWQWGGCSDNIAYGTRFSKRFTEAVENHRMKKKKSADQTLMNIHNSETGRRAVRDHMKVHCKCHGVSGSCNVKTCFRRLGDFREIAKFLRRKYDRIIYVKKEKSKSKTKKDKRKKKNDITVDEKEKKEKERKQEKISLKSKDRKGRKYTTKDLIALSRSPSYCRKDKRKGSYGTKGRICNPKMRGGKGSCNYMCCGRGYRSKTVTKEERCECQYVWCCYVKCKTCTKRERVYRCK